MHITAQISGNGLIHDTSIRTKSLNALISDTKSDLLQHIHKHTQGIAKSQHDKYYIKEQLH